jgi:tRNA (cmo5U34)-methyltransferase
MCDRFPFPHDARVNILDLGAGYGPVSAFILDRYPNATCVGQDGSAPMLDRARSLMGKYGARFTPHRSDLFAPDWLPAKLGSFDAAVSSICLHNLRDFTRIGEIYGEVRRRLKSGGVFLNLDLVNAPDGTGPFPAGLDEQLAALRAAGYGNVDCFWKDARLALFGGFA